MESRLDEETMNLIEKFRPKNKSSVLQNSQIPVATSSAPATATTSNAASLTTSTEVIAFVPSDATQFSQAVPNGQNTAVATPAVLVRTNKFGLFRLNPNDDITEGEYQLDIVAVHGITGDAFETWETKTKEKTLWLRDFLPAEFPGARIFSFGYDANIFWSKGTGNINDFARSLLIGLQRERRTDDVSWTKEEQNGFTDNISGEATPDHLYLS